MSIERGMNGADAGVSGAFMFAGGSGIGAAASTSSAATVIGGAAAPLIVTTATVAGAVIGGWRAVTTGREICKTIRAEKYEDLGHQIPLCLSNAASVPTFGMMGALNLSHFVATVAPASAANANLAVGAGVLAPIAPAVGIAFAGLMAIGSSVLAGRSYAARRELSKPDSVDVKGLIEKKRFAFSGTLHKLANEDGVDVTKLLQVAKKDNERQMKKYLLITAVALTMIAAFALMLAFPPGLATIAIVSGALFIALGGATFYLNPLMQNDAEYEKKLRKDLGLEPDVPLLKDQI